MLKKTKEVIIKNKRIIIFSIAMIIFIIIVKALFQKQIYIFDDYIYLKISKYMNPDLTSFLKLFTNLGGALILIIISIALLISLKNKNIGKYILINLVIITSINQLLKHVFIRQRPSILTLIEEKGYSFPSRTFYGKYGFLWIFNIFVLVKNR